MDSLKEYNSFNIEARADRIYNLSSVSELQELVKSGTYAKSNPLILGEGSNVLFTEDYRGTIYRAAFSQIEILELNTDNVLIKCDAGVNWDTFVSYCVEEDYGGIENLSLIPGTTGAAPIQNIGAYGAEVSDLIEKVYYIDLESGLGHFLSNSECRFLYRSSIFKTRLRAKVFISSVVFRLSFKKHHYNTSYGNLSDRVAQYGTASLKNIREAVISIRKEKLPDPDPPLT